MPIINILNPFSHDQPRSVPYAILRFCHRHNIFVIPQNRYNVPVQLKHLKDKIMKCKLYYSKKKELLTESVKYIWLAGLKQVLTWQI